MADPQIQIMNISDGRYLNIAFYPKLLLDADQPLTAWRVMSPHIGIRKFMTIPYNYAIYIKYKYNGLVQQSPPVPIENFQGVYDVTGSGKEIVINQVDPGDRGHTVRVNVRGEVGVPVEIYITLGSDMVIPKRTLMPNTSTAYVLGSSQLYVAFVDAKVTQGASMTQESVAPSEMIIRANQTVLITGTVADGYKMEATYD